MGGVSAKPPKSVTDAVDRRDGQSCRRCGVSLAVVSGSRHHRKRRQIGGHRRSNLILLCGSGTTGCHGWAHSHPEQAQREGLIIKARVGAAFESDIVPLYSLGRYFQLDDDGNEVEILETDARELLALVA